MRRREFITLVGGAAAAVSVARPRPSVAQQAALPVIGFLHSGSLGIVVPPTLLAIADDVVE